MTIKKKLTIFIPLVISIISMSLGAFFVWFLFNNEFNSASRNLQSVSMLKAESINNYIDDSENYVANLGASSVFRDLLKSLRGSSDYSVKKNLADTRINRILSTNSSLSGLDLIDTEGVILDSNDKTSIGKNVSNQEYFIEARKKTYIKEAYNLVSTPINDDATGKFLGIAVTRLSPGYIEKFATDIGVGSSGEVFLINRAGYFLTASRYLGSSVVLTKQISTDNTKACFDPNGQTQKTGFGRVFFFNDYRGVPSIGTNAYISQTDWCLITKYDKGEFYAPIYLLIEITIVGVIISAIFTIIVLELLSSRFVSAITKLQKGVEVIENGNLEYKLSMTRTDEIGDLSRSFDKMIMSLKESRAAIDTKVAEQTEEIRRKSDETKRQQMAILNILEDVEAEKNKASQERDKINIIVQSIGDGVVVLDSKMNIILVNRKAIEISGYSSSDEILSKGFNKVFRFASESDPKVPKNDFITKALTEGVNTEMTSRTVLTRKDDTTIAVSDSCAPLKDKNGSIIGCVVVFRDVTKERAIDRMKTEFISLASHQLRTPLTAIKWLLEMLLGGDAGTLTSSQTEYIKNISLSNERMIALVNSLLNISRIESGRLSVEPMPTKLPELVTNTIKEVQSKANEKKIEIRFEADPNLPTVNIDPKLIGEVYLNLLTNSVNYTGTGGVVRVVIGMNSTQIVSQVIDNGIGIPENQKNRVFERFFRADNAVKFRPDGTGLGLYLIKEIVEASGGNMWFESTEGKGSTFYFSIPISGSLPKKGEISLT